MKKWSISLVVASALLAVAAFALPASSGAVTGPYCPGPNPGEQYKPCEVTPPPTTPPSGGGSTTPAPPPAPTCTTGQVGTYPNCVAPAVGVGGIKLQPNSTTLTLKVNAPGTVKLSGKGVKAKLVKVSPGNVKIRVQLTSKEKKLLKKKGKVSLKVKITYTPTGGTPITKIVKITVKAPTPKKSHK
jgi:hypothetical protein